MKKKILLTAGLLSSIGALSLVALYLVGFIGINTVEANPDFVCVKSVTHGTCDHITSCGDWDLKTHTRTCYGYNVTKTAYYHTRTSCESGYTVEKKGSTASSGSASVYIANIDYNALDSEGKAATTSHPSSGRHSRDVVWETESCSITEVDTKAPVGVEQKEYK